MHTHTRAHTGIALQHKKPAEDPHRWASRLSPQGRGHLTLAPQEGGSLDFWDTQRGDPKTRRRRKSLKTFSLTPATFRGIWHWRVSAISLSGPVSTLPAPVPPPATCSPGSEVRLPLPPPPMPKPCPGTLKQAFRRAHFSVTHPFSHPLTHAIIHGQVFLLPLLCARHCTRYLESKYEKAWRAKRFWEMLAQFMSWGL